MLPALASEQWHESSSACWGCRGWIVSQLIQPALPSLRRFLRFVTGTPRLPPGGLAALQPRLTVVRKLSQAAMAGARGWGARLLAWWRAGIMGSWRGGGGVPSIAAGHAVWRGACEAAAGVALTDSVAPHPSTPPPFPTAAMEGTSAPVAQSLGTSLGGTSAGSAPGGPRHPVDGDLPSGADGVERGGGVMVQPDGCAVGLRA